MPDFYIGAYAATGYRLLTRDVRRYRTYFPTIDILALAPSEDETAGGVADERPARARRR